MKPIYPSVSVALLIFGLLSHGFSWSLSMRPKTEDKNPPLHPKDMETNRDGDGTNKSMPQLNRHNSSSSNGSEEEGGAAKRRKQTDVVDVSLFRQNPQNSSKYDKLYSHREYLPHLNCSKFRNLWAFQWDHGNCSLWFGPSFPRLFLPPPPPPPHNNTSEERLTTTKCQLWTPAVTGGQQESPTTPGTRQGFEIEFISVSHPLPVDCLKYKLFVFTPPPHGKNFDPRNNLRFPLMHLKYFDQMDCSPTTAGHQFWELGRTHFDRCSFWMGQKSEEKIPPGKVCRLL